MVQTIGNPLSWVAQVLSRGANSIGSGVQELGGVQDGPVNIRDIRISDLREALSKGAADFMAMRTDVLFIVIVYPIVGLFLFWFTLDRNILHLFFPFVSGFALLGPVAAIGLYELSRRRELGLDTGWSDGFGVLSSPAIVPILALGTFLAVLFLFWMVCAHLIFNLTLGPEPPANLVTFLNETFKTRAGWAMILIGVTVGLFFAITALAVSLVSFPMLIDRHVGVPVAVITSLNIAMQNPGTVAVWGAIIVAMLALGVLTLFVGLIFVLPIIGHATWHLYRIAVVSPNL